MLSYRDLVFAANTLQDQGVLTVYVNGEERDPGKRHMWRLELRHALDDIDRSLQGSTHAERESFATCRALAEERLSGFTGGVRAPGWVGFFTADGEHSSGTLPAGTPTLAGWSTGPVLSPFVRVLKESCPVIVAVVDSTSSKIYQYANRTAAFLETVRARTSVDAERHMGRPPRAGFHMGTRGPTESDRLQGEWRDATARMLGDVADRLEELAGLDGWILIGGIPNTAVAALKRLRPDLKQRAAHAHSLHSAATLADIAHAAREAVSRLRDADDRRRVDDALASFDSDGRGVAGLAGVLRALEIASVRELFFTPSFLAKHLADTETVVRRALSTDARIEQVSGEAAEILDRAGGIAARLRYAENGTEAGAVEYQAGIR